MCTSRDDDDEAHGSQITADYNSLKRTDFAAFEWKEDDKYSWCWRQLYALREKK